MARESEITAFITARLDEEETTAIGATKGPWSRGAEHGDPQRIINQRAAVIAETFTGPGHQSYDADHIIRQAPDRTLRKIRAMRKLLEAHVGYYGPGDDEFFPIPTLRLLAAIWDDHEDYPAALKAEGARDGR